jgi:pyridoxine 5-phosphate synthase
VLAARPAITDACRRLAGAGIRAALFIDPDPRQIDAAAACGAPVVELHTGVYAESSGPRQAQELQRLREAARHATAMRLEVHAGHGLHYHNVAPVAAITDIVELNIGHAIIARAVFEGLPAAVRTMKALMLAAR